jgi:hypothetical protein
MSSAATIDDMKDPAEERWLDEIAKTCRACQKCWDVPCGGCQQGAPCDAICRCDAFDDAEWDAGHEDDE